MLIVKNVYEPLQVGERGLLHFQRYFSAAPWVFLKWSNSPETGILTRISVNNPRRTFNTLPSSPLLINQNLYCIVTVIHRFFVLSPIRVHGAHSFVIVALNMIVKKYKNHYFKTYFGFLPNCYFLLFLNNNLAKNFFSGFFWQKLIHKKRIESVRTICICG